MSFHGDVYGKNPTRDHARRMISRGHTSAPRAYAPRSSAMHVANAIYCDGCGRLTTTGVVVPGATPDAESRWLCQRNCGSTRK